MSRRKRQFVKKPPKSMDLWKQYGVSFKIHQVTLLLGSLTVRPWVDEQNDRNIRNGKLCILVVISVRCLACMIVHAKHRPNMLRQGVFYIQNSKETPGFQVGFNI